MRRGDNGFVPVLTKGPVIDKGEKLEAYEPREVRRIIVGNYELRYEIADATIFILRLWHCRENRSFESED